MLSHDLARALLARRNNAIRVEVLVDDDPSGERAIWPAYVGLRDGGTATDSQWQVTSDEVVTYDPKADAVVIKANFVVTGDRAPDDDDPAVETVRRALERFGGEPQGDLLLNADRAALLAVAALRDAGLLADVSAASGGRAG